MKKIYIIDVTDRDGVQTSRIGLSKLEKTMVNRYLDKMGIWQSEFGFPTTRHETNYLNANLELAGLGAFKKIRLSGWLRALESDVEKAYSYVPGLRYMNISISTSRQMIKGKFRGKMKWADILGNVGKALDCAYSYGAKDVGVNAEDASRTKMDHLVEFAENAKAHGASRIRYCDTLGYDDPFTIYDRVKTLAKATGMDVETHCHNDLGMAVACTVAGAKAAIDAGVNAYMNTTINGVGERAGNADLVSCILAVRKASGIAKKYRLAGRVDLTKSWILAKYSSRGFNIPIPVNQVAVGSNAFAHESGIHVDGALKDHRNYELYHHREVGRGHLEEMETGRQITTGEYSGIKGFKSMAGNYKIKFRDDEEARELLELIRYANVHTQKPPVEDEVKFIAKYPEHAKKIMTISP